MTMRGIYKLYQLEEWAAGIDLDLLHNQRLTLYDVAEGVVPGPVTEEQADYLKGVLNMLDALHDILDPPE